MKPAVSPLLATAALLLPLALAHAQAASPARPRGNAVAAQRLAGTWYELARLPGTQDADCASDVTTRYVPRHDGRLAVTTSCRTATGRLDTGTALAWPADRSRRDNWSRMEVSTMPHGLEWLPLRRTEWRVVMLDGGGRVAVLSESSRQRLRLLSRTPTLPADLLGRIVDRLRAAGYPTNRLVLVRQDAVRHDTGSNPAAPLTARPRQTLRQPAAAVAA